ncbi:CCA tRNA nucleotidyltransferase, partial [Streptococcus pyogenes]
HDIVLNGSHLIKDFGMKPGPQLGLMLEKVELAIVEGRLDNDFTTIEAFVREELAT